MSYIPERGDFVWVDFDPAAGHEQQGQRPALVLSEQAFNKTIGLALVAPITSRVRGHGFEVPISDSSKINGVVLCQQLKTIDFEERGLQFVEQASSNVINEALRKIRVIVA